MLCMYELAHNTDCCLIRLVTPLHCPHPECTTHTRDGTGQCGRHTSPDAIIVLVVLNKTQTTTSVITSIAMTTLFRYTSITYVLVLGNVAGALQVVVVAMPIGDLHQSSTATQYTI